MRGLAGSWKAEATSLSHSVLLLPVGWQTGEKRPQAGVPRLKTGFQAWPCSPYKWPQQVTPVPALLSVSVPEKLNAQGLIPMVVLLNWVSTGFQDP